MWLAACLWCGGTAVGAQAAEVPASGVAEAAVVVPVVDPVVDSSLDVLLFKDGDRMSGELVRAEAGSVVFRSNKVGDVTVAFDHIRDLVSSHRFAVLRKGARVSQQNAMVGKIEVVNESLVVTPEKGASITLKSDEVAFAVDDATFEREVAHHTQLHEGWAVTLSLGGSLVRSTENGTAFNTDLALSRSLPGVEYLPRRNRTSIGIRDSYDLIRTANIGTGASETETHIFHAEAEHNEYIHTRFYVLGNYSFDRNYAQGLLAQQLVGGGVGWTVLHTLVQQLDLKSDLHRESQGFTDATNNDVLYGQKFVVDYDRSLPGNLNFHQTSDYLAAYNLPHRYSANTTAVISMPLFWHIGLSLTTTDNYLNNPLPGLKRNTLRVATSLTFSR